MAAAAPVILHPVPVEALTSPDDYIRCEPLGAIIRAAVCVERQRKHGTTVALNGWGKPKKDQTGDDQASKLWVRDSGRCADCELGRAVRAMMGD